MNRPDNTGTSKEAELRADIERTRERLGATVEALSHKADIPARTKEKAHEVGERVEHATESVIAKLPEPARQKAAGVIAYLTARPIPTALGLVFLVWLITWLTRRSSK
jgi:hypothetical protein